MPQQISFGEQQFLDANGVPLAGGTINTYIPGTTTNVTTYKDSGYSIPNTNPIVLDAAGRCVMWGDGLFRLVLKDSLGNLIYDQVAGGSVPATLPAISPKEAS